LGPANGPLEREADRVAARVDREAGAQGVQRSGRERLQRQTAGDATAVEEDLGADLAEGDEQDEEAEDTLTPDATGRPKLRADRAEGREILFDPPVGMGQPLDASVRARMERTVGFDFSRVRVHDDATAWRSADTLGARAYTLGPDVYFSRGEYHPSDVGGRQLLAHELAHVAQQGAAARQADGDRTIRRRPKGEGQPKGFKAGGCLCKKHPITCATKECEGCAPPASHEVRSPCCGNERCTTSGAADPTKLIKHIDVNVKTQAVALHLSSGAITSLVGSPNPSLTPTGSFVIGRKCGPCHTNQCGDGMGWFTGFHNDLEYGFHDSQRVGPGIHSHGCVRVKPCDTAKLIHDNTASGQTTVCVHKGGGCGGKAGGKQLSPGGVRGDESAPLVSDLVPPAPREDMTDSLES